MATIRSESLNCSVRRTRIRRSFSLALPLRVFWQGRTVRGPLKHRLQPVKLIIYELDFLRLKAGLIKGGISPFHQLLDVGQARIGIESGQVRFNLPCVHEMYASEEGAIDMEGILGLSPALLLDSIQRLTRHPKKVPIVPAGYAVPCYIPQLLMEGAGHQLQGRENFLQKVAVAVEQHGEELF